LKYRAGFDRREEVRYQNNGGYALTVSNLRWGMAEFTVKRYRTTKTENWLESETAGKSGRLEISNPLPPPGVELIVIRQK
jgi:hypothetical protein